MVGAYDSGAETGGAAGSGASCPLAMSIQLGEGSAFLLPLGAGTVVNDPNMVFKRGVRLGRSS